MNPHYDCSGHISIALRSWALAQLIPAYTRQPAEFISFLGLDYAQPLVPVVDQVPLPAFPGREQILARGQQVLADAAAL